MHDTHDLSGMLAETLRASLVPPAGGSRRIHRAGGR